MNMKKIVLTLLVTLLMFSPIKISAEDTDAFNPSDWTIDLSEDGRAVLTAFHNVETETLYIPGGYIFDSETTPRQIVMKDWKPITTTTIEKQIKSIIFEEQYGMKVLIERSNWDYNATGSNSFTFFAGVSKSGNKTIEHADLSGLETSHVTTMKGLFFNNSKLQSINMDGWDTSNVESMRLMFANLIAIKSLDVSHFNTSKVKDMSTMFYGNNELEDLNINNIDTTALDPSLKPIHEMFALNPKLTYLDLRDLQFDPSLTTNSFFVEFSIKQKYLISDDPKVSSHNYNTNRIVPFTPTVFDAKEGELSNGNKKSSTVHKVVNTTESADKYQALVTDMIETPPTREGYTFLGWSPALTSETSIKDTLGKTYTAQYERTKHKVDFDTDGSDSMDSVFVEEDTLLTEPNKPSKDHYHFEGWYRDTAKTIAWDFENDIVSEPLTLYAKWKVEKYKVIFDHEDVEDQDIEYNELLIKPADPAKEGYTFKGWYREETYQNEWNFNSDRVDQAMTLYPKFDIKTFTVNYKTDGGSSAPSETVDYHQQFTKPNDPIKEHYDFKGWYQDSNYTQIYDFSKKVEADITLYAKWEAKYYTVVIHLADGSTATETIQYGTLMKKPTDPIKEHYTFDGWYKDEALTDKMNFEEILETNVDLYPKWNVNLYTVTFISDQKKIDENKYAYDTHITGAPILKKPGYTFAGWYTSNDYQREWNLNEDIVSKDLVLYAKWNNNHVKEETTPPTAIQNQAIFYLNISLFALVLIVLIKFRISGNRRSSNH